MLQSLLFLLLQTHDYSKPKSGAEALVVGLLSGALLWGISAGIRAIRKASQKERDATKIK